MKKISPTLLLSLYLFVGCSKGAESFETKISGRYKVISFESAQELDLNNDGIKSTNIYAEITDPHYTPDNKKVSFYDFEQPSNYLEIRPTKETTNDAQLLWFSLPTQNIVDSTPNKSYLSEYLNSVVTYTYTLERASNQIKLSPEYHENGTLHSFGYQSNGQLILSATREFFDLTDQKWLTTEITIVYEKVEE